MSGWKLPSHLYFFQLCFNSVWFRVPVVFLFKMTSSNKFVLPCRDPCVVFRTESVQHGRARCRSAAVQRDGHDGRPAARHPVRRAGRRRSHHVPLLLAGRRRRRRRDAAIRRPAPRRRRRRHVGRRGLMRRWRWRRRETGPAAVVRRAGPAVAEGESAAVCGGDAALLPAGDAPSDADAAQSRVRRAEPPQTAAHWRLSRAAAEVCRRLGMPSLSRWAVPSLVTEPHRHWATTPPSHVQPLSRTVAQPHSRWAPATQLPPLSCTVPKPHRCWDVPLSHTAAEPHRATPLHRRWSVLPLSRVQLYMLDSVNAPLLCCPIRVLVASRLSHTAAEPHRATPLHRHWSVLPPSSVHVR